jgi:hypothetical protein
MKTMDPDTAVLDEVAAQMELNHALDRTLAGLDHLETGQRAWLMGKLAEAYCPLCGRPRTRLPDNRLRMCKHGDTS